MIRIVIGGGAAGVFGAIASVSGAPEESVAVLESGKKLLAKVEISGGGRCNVTHACYDPAELRNFYPRGSKELRGPFTRFQPRNTIEWFERRQVALKTESDGRIFPVSDKSQTIMNALLTEARAKRISLRTGVKVKALERSGEAFLVTVSDGEVLKADQILLASGGAKNGHELASGLGHTITECAPSLFTFEIAHPLLENLSGTSFPQTALELNAGGKTFSEKGPLLITHWGLSGPSVLRLSAWAARELARTKYDAKLIVNWTGGKSETECKEELKLYRDDHPKQQVHSNPMFGLSRNFWARIAGISGLEPEALFHSLSNADIRKLSGSLTRTELQVRGKGVFKEEFVTCGGVLLSEVDFRTMESKIIPNLFFAGEILDIDGVTGGFNFQSAWTTGWIAGESMRKAMPSVNSG